MNLLPTAVRTPDCYLLQPTVPGLEVPGAARSSTARRAGGGGARIPTRPSRRGWGGDCAHDPETGADLPDYDQSQADARLQKARADAAETRAAAAHNEVQAAQRRIAELEERLRLRGEL